MKNVERMPLAAATLGLGGLIPFVGLPLLAVSGAAPDGLFWLQAMAAYGATIASFVGALHWAFALRRDAQGAAAWLQYGWSVVPALVAWVSLLLPIQWTLLVQAVLLVACLLADSLIARRDPVPPWLPRLRAVLTGVAVTALLFAAQMAL